MTTRRACAPAPGPLEVYCTAFDPLWRSLAQRRGFRDYLTGLLRPRDRSKTITALVDAAGDRLQAARSPAAALVPHRGHLGPRAHQRPAAVLAT
jgi:hypothetical protein